MTNIQWSQIEAECGDYRAGFVATFRKYEGMETDERDGSNRIVKVTVATFASHTGIPETTFRRWLGLMQEVDAARGGHLGSARRFAEKLPAAEKAKLAAELLDDEEVEQEPVVQRATERVAQRSAARRFDPELREMRQRGADPDEEPEPFPADLVVEASRIAAHCDGIVRDVTRLLDRAEPDQRPALVERIEPRAMRILQALGVGTVIVPDFVPEEL